MKWIITAYAPLSDATQLDFHKDCDTITELEDWLPAWQAVYPDRQIDVTCEITQRITVCDVRNKSAADVLADMRGWSKRLDCR